jgi:hypothetical protein
MASKVKNVDFSGCQHLRKVFIGVNVEVEQKLDLTDTPLKDRNDVFKADEKNIQDGITATDDFIRNKVRFKIETAEMGTQMEEEHEESGDLLSIKHPTTSDIEAF